MMLPVAGRGHTSLATAEQGARARTSNPRITVGHMFAQRRHRGAFDWGARTIRRTVLRRKSKIVAGEAMYFLQPT